MVVCCYLTMGDGQCSQVGSHYIGVGVTLASAELKERFKSDECGRRCWRDANSQLLILLHQDLECVLETSFEAKVDSFEVCVSQKTCGLKQIGECMKGSESAPSGFASVSWCCSR